MVNKIVEAGPDIPAVLPITGPKQPGSIDVLPPIPQATQISQKIADSTQHQELASNRTGNRKSSASLTRDANEGQTTDETLEAVLGRLRDPSRPFESTAFLANVNLNTLASNAPTVSSAQLFAPGSDALVEGTLASTTQIGSTISNPWFIPVSLQGQTFLALNTGIQIGSNNALAGATV